MLSDGDRTGGYILAAPDTAAFEARLARDWWPNVRARLIGFKPATAHDKMALQRINAPRNGTTPSSSPTTRPICTSISCLKRNRAAGAGV